MAYPSVILQDTIFLPRNKINKTFVFLKYGIRPWPAFSEAVPRKKKLQPWQAIQKLSLGQTAFDNYQECPLGLASNPRIITIKFSPVTKKNGAAPSSFDNRVHSWTI